MNAGLSSPAAKRQVPVLELRHITKTYGRTRANDDVSLVIHPGYITALLGENGAGKSTLLKTIAGAVRPDSGEMLWNGREARPSDRRAIADDRIAMVHQHFSLFETLTIGENIALSIRLPAATIAARIKEFCDSYGWNLSPRTVVYSLSYGERQQVEIIRCLMRDPALLIMDEPTSVLSPDGIEKLFVTLRRLAGEGKAVLFTSHKLDEVRALCHDAVIMRRGRVVGTAIPSEVSAHDLAEQMMGNALLQVRHTPATPAERPVLEIENLDFRPEDPFGRGLESITLKVRPGELVGIVGVSGNGQRELVDLVTGEQLPAPAMAGRIRFGGVAIGARDIHSRRKAGIALIPEERLGRASVPELSLAENILLAARQLGLVRRGALDRRAAWRLTQTLIERHDIRCRGPEAEARSLSGGNLQKFIAAREIALRPRLLVAVQPTWGLDVMAAYTLRQKLMDLRAAGVGILVVSDELKELLEISDRIHVMNRGRLSVALDPRTTPLSRISALMTGAEDDTPSLDGAARPGPVGAGEAIR